jgi:hypothetical protein
MSVLIGSQFYKAHVDSERRQAQAMDALGTLQGVEAVDLQCVEVVAHLLRDSR